MCLCPGFSLVYLQSPPLVGKPRSIHCDRGFFLPEPYGLCALSPNHAIDSLHASWNRSRIGSGAALKEASTECSEIRKNADCMRWNVCDSLKPQQHDKEGIISPNSPERGSGWPRIWKEVGNSLIK